MEQRRPEEGGNRTDEGWSATQMFIKLVTAKSSSAGPLSYWWIVCQPILYALPKPTHICYNYCTLGPQSWVPRQARIVVVQMPSAKERALRICAVSANRRLIAQSFLRARDVVISGSSTAIAGVKRAPVAPRHSHQGTMGKGHANGHWNCRPAISHFFMRCTRGRLTA